MPTIHLNAVLAYIFAHVDKKNNNFLQLLLGIVSNNFNEALSHWLAEEKTFLDPKRISEII